MLRLFNQRGSKFVTCIIHKTTVTTRQVQEVYKQKRVFGPSYEKFYGQVLRDFSKNSRVGVGNLGHLRPFHVGFSYAYGKVLRARSTRGSRPRS